MENEMQSGEQQMEAAAPQDYVNENPQTESRQVPLEALEAERSQRQNLAEENKRISEELKTIKDHINLIQAQQYQDRNPPKSEFDEYSKDDVPTYGDIEKFFNEREKKYQGTIDEIRMAQKYPDYEDVITKYIPEIVKQNPSIAKTLQQTQNYELAYYLAKNSEGYRKNQKKQQQNTDATRILENSNQPGNLSAVGQSTAMSQAKRYKQMSDAEFMQEVKRNMGYT